MPFQEPKLEVPTIYIYIRSIFHYFSGLCKGISPQNMEWKMVLTYLHFRILKFLLTKDIQSTDLAMPKIFSEDVTVLFSGFIARGYAAMLCFFFKLSGMFRGTHILISCAHQCLGNMEKLLSAIYPNHFLDDWNMLYPH